MEMAQQFFRQAGRIDLDNNMGNAAGGVHMAALGGLWQAAAFGFGGARWGPDGLTLDPHLPANWHRLAFTLTWRESRLRIEVEAEPMTVTVSLEGGPIAVRVAGGSLVTLAAGRPMRTRRQSGRWDEWQGVRP